MTADTITAIKKALEGVTPGPWHAGHLGGEGKCQCSSILSEGISGAICTIHVNNGKRIGEGGNDAPPLSEAIANMHYIAAVNPVAISELLSTLESLQRENEKLREQRLAWRPMGSAPKDGTLVLLLVVPDGEQFTPFDDSMNPYETIGFNNLADTTEDRWEFAGWDWQQDCFITGRGEVIGWSPFGAKRPDPIREAVQWCLDRDKRNGSLPEAYAERLRSALSSTGDTHGN